MKTLVSSLFLAVAIQSPAQERDRAAEGPEPPNETPTYQVEKRLTLSGDGGQGTVEMTVLGWRKGFLWVRVDYEFESDRSSEILTRTKNGWSRQSENKEGEQVEDTDAE